MKPARLTFINRFYWPDQPATAQLLTDLAEALSAIGHRVEVISRTPETQSQVAEKHGVVLTRIQTSRLGKKSLLGRVFDFATFLSGVRRHLVNTLRERDVVVCMTDPPLLGSACLKIVQRRQGRLVHWIQDVFPEVAAEVSGLRVLNQIQGVRNRAWRSAKFCVTPGEDMREHVIACGVSPSQVITIPNWAPEGVRPSEPEAWRAEHGLTDKFVIMYSGNLGRVHDFSAIVPLSQQFAANPRIQMVFVGSGGRLEALREEVQEANLRNVTFLPAQPRELLGQVLSSGDVHLVTLRAGCEHFVFPSKLYGITAVGRPIVFLGPIGCELARLVRQHGFGEAFAPNGVDAAATYLARLAQNGPERTALAFRSLQFGLQHQGVRSALDGWRALLARLQ